MVNERKSAITVFIMIAATLISKLLGMLRGVFLAAAYGTGIESEAFAAASKIPLTFFDLLLGAAILGCFIPVYNSFGEKRQKEGDVFASTFLNTVVLITGLMSLIGIFFSDQILAMLSPKLNAESAILASKLLKIMFPMITFTGSAYVLVGVLQSKGSFIIPSLISAVSNGAIIVYFIFFNTSLGINGLAFAYLIAWLLQLSILIYPLIKNNFSYYPVLKYNTPEMKKALKTTFPIMAGSWLSPATVLIGTFFSPYTRDLSPLAVFDFANNLFIIIAGILTYGLCNFIFPTLSRLASSENEEYSNAVKSGISTMLLIIIPVAAGVFVLNKEIVCIVYKRGDFNAISAISTAKAFLGFSIGIIGYSLIEILNRVFYSKGKTSPPVIAALIGIIVNVGICTIFSFAYGEQKIPSLLFISSAVSIGLMSSAIYLLYRCRREISGVIDKKFAFNSFKIIVSGFFALLIMQLISFLLKSDAINQSIFKNFLFCAIIFSSGAIVFLLLCFIFDIEEKQSIINMVRKKKSKEGEFD